MEKNKHDLPLMFLVSVASRKKAYMTHTTILSVHFGHIFVAVTTWLDKYHGSPGVNRARP
jgi:hypothetical protein